MLLACFRTTMSDVGLPDFKSTIISFSGKLKLPKWKTGEKVSNDSNTVGESGVSRDLSPTAGIFGLEEN